MPSPPSLLWAAAAAAYWLAPDRKLLRWKLVGVESALLLAAAWALWRAFARPEPRRAPLDLPVALLGASAPLFWLLSPERGASEGELARLGLCCVAYFAASRSLSADDALGLARAWTALGAAAALQALAQGLGLYGAAVPRPAGSFGNPIFLGAALAAALPLAAALAAESSGRARLLWGGAAALLAAALLATRSRAALLAALGAAALWGALRLSGAARARLLGALALAGAAAAASWRGREWTHGLIWRDALALWRESPALGVGLGRFHLEFPAFASEALKARWPEGRVVVNFAHNEYLQTLCETGVLGLGLLLAVPAAAVALLARAPRDERAPLREAALLAGLSFFGCALVSPDARFGVSAFAAFAWLGAAASLSARPAPPLPRPALAALALPLLGWAALATRPVLAARAQRAERPFAAPSRELEERIRALEERLARAPEDADLAESLGFLYAKASDWERAISRFELAARLDPARPGPLNNLGNVHYTLGAFDRAIEHWRRSLAAAPGQIDARLNLAKLYYERGRLKEAAAELEEVLRRDPGNAKARVMHKRMIE